MRMTSLIDCGATHNFMSLEVIEELNLSITATTSYGVVIGAGIQVKGKQICKWVVVEM